MFILYYKTLGYILAFNLHYINSKEGFFLSEDQNFYDYWTDFNLGNLHIGPSRDGFKLFYFENCYGC